MAAPLLRFQSVIERQRIEKLGYMHAIPVKRELLLEPEQWQLSSYHRYITAAVRCAHPERAATHGSSEPARPFSSWHQNTQTGKLTWEMFVKRFMQAAKLADTQSEAPPGPVR
ncbi:MAG: hypothetical protein DMG99_19060 [Acidobacteria bacterium]|nr:MAG: hypothetical protein DMG99_19060 [Acidobacteriota bacterium]